MSSGVEDPLARVLGVADHPGGAADEGVRRVAGLLQPPGGEDLHEVAHVQARCRRVEARRRTGRCPRPAPRAARRGRSSARSGRATRGRRGGSGSSRWIPSGGVGLVVGPLA